MSFFDETEDEATERVRKRMKAAREARAARYRDTPVESEHAPAAEPEQEQPAAAESVVAQPEVSDTSPVPPTLVSVGIDPSEVPAGAVVHESIESALAAVALQPVSAGASDLASFARARLRALLTDSSVRDPELVAAAKALLRDHPERSAASTEQQTIFVIPTNDRGPLPHAPIYLRETAYYALSKGCP